MDQLKKEGWNINHNQTAELFTDGVLPVSSNDILKTILNEDIRNFGEASIINLHRKEDESFEGPCVLQLLRYRNVSVPRIKEEMNQTDPASSVIRLFLTDGHTSVSAIVLQSIPGITADTPPGTKVLISGKVPMEGTFMILTKTNVKVLGGRVEELIEKWNVERNSVRADGFKSKSAAGKGTGAPKWVSFGKRGQKGQLEKGFKANSVIQRNIKEGEDADEFAKNREQILKELGTDESKTFAKPNLAPPPPKDKPAPIQKEYKEPQPRKEFKRRGRKNSEDGPDIDVGEYANHKPSGGVTLFDFIGGEEKAAVTSSQEVRKITEQTSRLNVSGAQSSSKFGHDNKRGGDPRGNRSDRGGKSRGEPRGKPQNYSDPRGSQSRSGPRNETERPATRSYPKNQENQKTPRTDNALDRKSERNPSTQQSNQVHGNQTARTTGNHKPPRNQQNQGGASNFPQPRGANQNFTPRQYQQYQNRNASHQDLSPHQNQPNRNSNRENTGNRQDRPRPQYENQQRQTFQTFGNTQQGRGGQFGNFHHQVPQWRVGSHCLAAWNDGNLYPATITDLLPNRTATVRYNDYNTFQTIPIDFLILPQ